MSEIREVYINNPTYPNITYITEWLNVSSSVSLTFTIFEDNNCDIVLDWAIDNNYNIINTETTALIGGNSTTIYTPVKNRFVRLSVINIAVQPSVLEVQGFHYITSGLGLAHLENVGGFVELFVEPSSLRTLQSSNSSITVTQNSDNIDLLNNGVISLDHNVPPFANSYSIVKSAIPASGNVILNWLTDDNTLDGGVIWTENVSGYLTAKATLSGITLSSAGGTQTLVTDGTGPTLGIKGLTAGTNITLTPTANDITISSAGSNWTVSGSGASGYVYPTSVRGVVSGTSNTILTPTDIGILGSNGSTVKGSQSVIVGSSSCYQLTGDIISQCGIYSSSSCYQNVPTGGNQFRRNVTMACSESSMTPSGVSIFDSVILGCFKGYINQGSRCGVLFSDNSTVTSSGSDCVILASSGGVGSNSSITGASSKCVILGGSTSTIAGCVETIVIGPSVTCTGNKSFSCNLGSTAWTTSTANKWNVKAPGGAVFYSDDSATVGVELASGAGSWASVSDMNKKENLVVVDYNEIMDKVDKLNVYSYNYKGNPSAQRCYGTVAQEWHNEDTFKCNEYEVDDIDEEGNPVKVMKCGKNCLVIETQDQIGVLMACVKFLHKQLKEQELRIKDLEARVL